MTTETRLDDAVKAWRESLVMLSGRNRLLNYRPTKSSTLEFIRASADEVLGLIGDSRGVPIVGVVPSAPNAGETIGTDDLEGRALEVVEDFDYSKFNDHLLVNKTQREVDRALKSLSATASREYLDRGLSVLYLALGAVHWREANGDPRVSPVVFRPVALKADGPRQPPRLYSSDEDLVINPALEIRLREFGVSLPAQSHIEELLADGGVAAVEMAIGALPLPEGWRVEPLCVLSAFMFAKEAMFRDLELNQDSVLASPVIQALAGASDEARAVTLFAPDAAEDVDHTSPPEAASLILDADSSQRVAVAAAAAGKSFVLDGPPGTGKSQTIANIIATLVSDGKRVLFVSEKAVALDVVRDRLSGRGLGPLLFELHSHKATRAEVARALGSSLTERPSILERVAPAELARLKKLRIELSDYAAAMNEERDPIGWRMHDVIGELAGLPSVAHLPSLDQFAADLTGESWNEMQDILRAVVQYWGHIVQGERHLWHGIQDSDGLSYILAEARRALAELVSELDSVAPRRAKIGLDGTHRWREVNALANHLRQADGDWFDAQWLSNDDISISRVPALLNRVSALLTESELLREIFGEDWMMLRAAEEVPLVSSEPLRLIGLDESAAVAVLESAITRADEWLQLCAAARAKASRIASSAGLSLPHYTGDLRSTTQSVLTISAIEGLRITWLTSAGLESLTAALEALDSSQRQAEAAETAALRSFRPTITSVDVGPIRDRWQALPQWKRVLFGPSADDRRVVGPHTSLKPRAAVAASAVAASWQAARVDLAEKSSDVENLLGFVPIDEESWARARLILEQCRWFRDAHPTADISKLADTYRGTYEWRALLRESSELEAALASAEASFAKQPYADPSLQLDTALPALHSAVDSIRRALSSAAPFAGGGLRTLGEARTLRGRITDAAREADAVGIELGSLERELSGLAGPRTHEWVSALRARLEWSQQLRDIVSAEARRSSIDVLREVAWTDSLTAAGERWDAACVRLRERFEDDRYGLSLGDEEEATAILVEMTSRLDEADLLMQSVLVRKKLDEAGLGAVLDALIEQEAPESVVEPCMRAVVLRAWTEAVSRRDPRLAMAVDRDRNAIVDQFRDLDRKIVDHTASTVLANAVNRRPTTPSGQTALILGEASKRRRHIPVRELISKSADVIQAIHPCFMMSPLAVSQYLPSDIEFDVVIFDEASQVPPGDAINCLYRAKALIAAGDRKQLPPTAFFSSVQGEDDDAGDDDLAHDYESLLDLMKGSGAFTTISLNWHYRSRHEHLIAYSNNAFYEDRLITFPGAMADVPDAGVKFHRVAGVYRRSLGQDNPKEAEYVADRVIHHLDARPGKSIGVVAMSAAQRDAITNALVLRRAGRPDLESHFAESRMDGIFVKSLEEVQGDERDVIVMSVGYGPDITGTVYRNFGPINSNGGERRLNVAITRAKELTEVVASMSAGDIGDIASVGGRHLRRYLDYAERGPAALEMELGPDGRATDSPFEDSVIRVIRSLGYEVQPQVGVSGFRIDIGVKHPNRPGVFMLGVECDGAMYHSAKSARDRDRLRHDILVGLGWNMHHIWGTDWYRRRDREVEKLKTLLARLESGGELGRLVERPDRRSTVTTRFETQDIEAHTQPEWIADYVVASPRQLRNLDWTDVSNARHLVPFVETVVAAESPVHIEILKLRLRERSSLDRVNKHAERTLREAIARADVVFTDDFLRKRNSRVTQVRTLAGRTVEQIHGDEFGLAVLKLLASQVGSSRADLALAVARAFGWRRTGPEITARVNAVIDQGIARGDIEDGDGVLRMKGATR